MAPSVFLRLVFLSTFLAEIAQSRSIICSNKKTPSWGRCALVGSSNSLEYERHGVSIDMHDTVLRFGWPDLSHLKKDHYGTKQHVAIFRRPLKDSNLTSIKGPAEDCANAVNDRHANASNRSLPRITLYSQPGARWPPQKGGKPLVHTCSNLPSDKSEPGTVLCAVRIPTRFLWRNYSKFKENLLPPRPTTGLVYATALLLAKVCESLSVYGLANPKYLNNIYGRTMKGHHSINCE